MLQIFPGVYAIKHFTTGFADMTNFIAYADHDYILDEIEPWDHIEYERLILNYDK